MKPTERAFEILFENNPLPMAIYDPQTRRYLAVNTAQAACYKYSVEEMVSSTLDLMFYTEDQAQMQASVASAPVAGHMTNLWRLRRKDGNPVWVEANSYQIDYQGKSARLVISKDITEQVQAEKALCEAERNYRSIFENAIDGIFQTSVEGKYLCANPALARIYGYATPEEMLTSLQDITHQLYVDPQRRQEFVQQMQQSERVSNFEAQVYHRDGSIIWIAEQARIVSDDAGNALYYEGTVQDITERKAADEALRQAEASYRSIFENALEGIYRVSSEGKIIKANPALVQMLGFETSGELIEQLVETRSNYVDLQRCQDFADLIATHDYVTGFEYQIYSRTGEIVWITENAHVERDENGTLLYYEGTMQDITVRKRLEAERELLLAEALERGDHDPLTGLLNHRALHKRYAEEIARAQRDGTSLAVAVFDMDSFKFFNDSYGHAIGDDVLRQVANTLRRCSRSYDILARFGGDEFAMLMPGMTAEDAARAAERLSTEMSLMGYLPPGSKAPIPLGLSRGLAIYPEDTLEQESLLEIADARLLQSKAMGSENGEIESVRLHLTGTFQGFSMLDALVTSVDNKDRYTRRHSEDVMQHALKIAQQMGLSAPVQQTIQIAALLHDIGKIGVPDKVLRKPGSLTDEEFHAIKQHPIIGGAIVGAVPGFEETLDAIRYHHERWDGLGYPSGLVGIATPLSARIMAVADAYSAMTMDRPYRKGFSSKKALAVLVDGAGCQWDPDCVVAFQCALNSSPQGEKDGSELDCTLKVRQKAKGVYSKREPTNHEPQTPNFYQRVQAASHSPSSSG